MKKIQLEPEKTYDLELVGIKGEYLNNRIKLKNGEELVIVRNPKYC